MTLELKIQLLKFCSAVFNSIFMVLGLSVGGCALWILFDQGSLLTILSSVELRTMALGLLVIGGVVIAVGVTGCVGADRELRFLLLIYLGVLIILILGQLFVTLLLLINRNKIEQSLDEAVDQVIFKYGDHGTMEDALMDNVQHYGRCCGRTEPSDWLRNFYIQSLNLSSPDILPCSCFSSNLPSFNSSWCSELLNFTEPLFGQGNGAYDQGCKQKLSVWLQENTLTIIVMDVGLILIQVIQFFVMVCLYRAFAKKASLKPLKHANHLANLDHTPSEHLNDGEQNYGYVDPDYHYLDPAHDQKHLVDHPPRLSP